MKSNHAPAKHPRDSLRRGCTNNQSWELWDWWSFFHWWVMSEVSVSSNGIATAWCWIPIRVGVMRFWTWWSCHQVLCFVWFEQGWTFLQITKHIHPPQKTTNNKYEFCSLSTLDLYLPQTSCRIQGIPEDLSTSPPPPPDTAPVHIRFAWSFARRCMRCLRALEACSFFFQGDACLVGTS